MPTFEDELRAALATAQRAAVLELLRQHLGLEHLEILLVAEREMGPMCRSITLGELLDSAPPAARARRRTRVEAQSRFNTRRKVEREALDKAVLGVLRKKGTKVAIGLLASTTRATHSQVRQSLRRLEKCEKVRLSGDGHERRYQAHPTRSQR